MAANNLTELLDLEVLDRDLFRGRNELGAQNRISLFGGQVAAQALRAASLTVTDDRLPHSLHGYFLRPGRIDVPVLFRVDRDRDGGSFSARHVRAVQEGEVIFSMLASFHAAVESPTFDGLAARPAPSAEQLPERPVSLFLADVREVTPTRVVGDKLRLPDRIWVRSNETLPDDPLVHACAIAYVSDLGTGFGQLEVDGLATGGPSIDHAVWFHEPIRADEWMLLELEPAKAVGGRGVYRGTLRDADGRLGAAVTQETLLRDRPLDPQTKARVAEFFGVVPED